MDLEARYVINIHKASTIVFIISLMFYYDNFGTGAFLYLSLHGTYCVLWLIKEQCFPDKSFEEGISALMFVTTFVVLGPLGYWMAPFLLIRSGLQPAPPMIGLAVTTNILGVFLHFCGDCQKYFTLKYQPGLIQEGLFSRSRNINYLGEILIYLGFNLASCHWLPFIVQAMFVIFLFYPNMWRKDSSLSRHKEFKSYQATTGLLFPRIF